MPRWRQAGGDEGMQLRHCTAALLFCSLLQTSPLSVQMKCFLDVAIGDRQQHEQDVAAHQRACGFFCQCSSQVGAG